MGTLRGGRGAAIAADLVNDDGAISGRRELAALGAGHGDEGSV
jgi:hypothetical protein